MFIWSHFLGSYDLGCERSSHIWTDIWSIFFESLGVGGPALVTQEPGGSRFSFEIAFCLRRELLLPNSHLCEVSTLARLSVLVLMFSLMCGNARCSTDGRTLYLICASSPFKREEEVSYLDKIWLRLALLATQGDVVDSLRFFSIDCRLTSGLKNFATSP